MSYISIFHPSKGLSSSFIKKENSLFPTAYAWDITSILIRHCAGSIGMVDGGLKKVTKRGRDDDDRGGPTEGIGVRTQIHLRMEQVSISLPTYAHKHSWAIQSVRYRNEQKKFRCQNQSGTRIRRSSPEPEYSGTGLRYRMPECQCRWHRPRCRCPAMLTKCREALAVLENKAEPFAVL